MNPLSECAIHRMIVTLRTLETAMRLPWHREMLMEGAELTLKSAEVYLERSWPMERGSNPQGVVLAHSSL